MTDKDLTDLKAMASALAKSTVDYGAGRASLDEIVGESYVKELAIMTEAEAVGHLRSSSGKKLLHAYLVLSARPNYALRANHPVFAEVCLRFMASTNELDRVTGASEIGIWLSGTNDTNASHVLALMICNHEETDAVKSSAYTSLELINNRKTMMEIVRRNWQATETPVSIVTGIDWSFVRSFL